MKRRDDVGSARRWLCASALEHRGQPDEARLTMSESTTKAEFLTETPPWDAMHGVSARGGDAPVDMAAGGGRGPEWSAYGRPLGTGAR